jgi:hypothetical protein
MFLSLFGRVARGGQARRSLRRKGRTRTLHLEILEDRTVLSTFTVLTTSDSGPGSLRQAILDANATPNVGGPDLISFNIPGSGVQTIAPASPLPTISDPVVLDGTTQPAYAGSPLIELTGSSAGAGVGLRITAGSSTVKGLVINAFLGGVSLLTNGGNLIVGNYIGTDAAGTAARANFYGVFISGPNNTVGGTTAGARNLISGNGEGVAIVGSGATGNQVLGNYIGTDAAGTAAVANFYGLSISTSNNTVGGTAAGARNLISGNIIAVQIGGNSNQVLGNYIGTNAAGTAAVANYNGMFISGSNNTVGGTAAGARNLISGTINGPGVFIFSSSGNQVLGNYIGTDAAGTAALANATGVLLAGSNNTLGGTTAGARNLISGNSYGVGLGGNSNQVLGNYIGTDAAGTAALANGTGVFISGLNDTLGGTAAGARNLISGNGTGVGIGGTSNQVLGNYIGTNAAGTGPLGNSSDGVSILGGQNDTIGGTAAGAGNTIAFNGGNGIAISLEGGTGNAILRNSIFSNAGLGIDLGADGVTPNDPGDDDTGPNNLQNFPALHVATTSPGGTAIRGDLHSTANTTFRLEFFANSVCDPSGFGEGETFLGATTVTTNPGGVAPFLATFPTAVPEGQFVTATATDPSGNTSEFSACLVVQSESDGAEDPGPGAGKGAGARARAEPPVAPSGFDPRLLSPLAAPHGLPAQAGASSAAEAGDRLTPRPRVEVVGAVRAALVPAGAKPHTPGGGDSLADGLDHLRLSLDEVFTPLSFEFGG